MLTVYVAHVFSGNQQNATDAEKWTAWLNDRIGGAVFLCPWLPMVRYWPDCGSSRRRGLMLDLACVRKFDALIALSPLVGGVEIEWEAATNRLSVDTSGPNCDAEFDRIEKTTQQWIDSLQATEPEGC